jgi:Domain of Unknown Function (DUF1206)
VRREQLRVATSARRIQVVRCAVQKRAEKTQTGAQKAKGSLIARALPKVGLSARATAYLILGGIAMDILLGSRAKQASSTGAFEVIAHQPAGRVLLTILVFGLVAYAAWRFLQAAAGEQRRGEEETALKRIGWLAIGIGYLLLAYEAVQVVVSGSGNQTSSNATPLSRTLLEHSGGQFLLGALGIALGAGGIGLLAWAGSQGFSRYLRLRARPMFVEVGGRVVETFGQATRGGIVTAIGFSFVVAAVRNRPHDSKGLDTALLSLASNADTRWIVGVIAAGMFCYGIASLVEAVYRGP